jgi:hypothetical protein
MDAWLGYAPVKNNPEDAAKVRIFYKPFVCSLELIDGMGISKIK